MSPVAMEVGLIPGVPVYFDGNAYSVVQWLSGCGRLLTARTTQGSRLTQ